MEDITLALPVNPYVRTNTILHDVTANVGLAGFNATLLAFADYDGDSLVDLFARGTDRRGAAQLEAWVWVRAASGADQTVTTALSEATLPVPRAPPPLTPRLVPLPHRRAPTACASSLLLDACGQCPSWSD